MIRSFQDGWEAVEALALAVVFAVVFLGAAAFLLVTLRLDFTALAGVDGGAGAGEADVFEDMLDVRTSKSS